MQASAGPIHALVPYLVKHTHKSELEFKLELPPFKTNFEKEDLE